MEPLLSGVRVLSLEVGIAGSFASMVLGDLGAEVIKIESPQGDALRTLEETKHVSHLRTHFYFLAHNRNKKSLVLDLGTPLGKTAFFDLIRVSDVIICNFRTGALSRLGAGYETLKKLNPGIIVCNITGFGDSGPYKDRPCYDLVGYGWSGLLSLSGEPGRKPVKPAVPVGDQGAALYAVAGVLAGLYRRERTGEGCEVGSSVLDACVALLSTAFSKYFLTGEIPEPVGAGHLAVAPSGIYRTKNGHVTLGVCWPRIARIVDAEWMIDDPRFSTLTARLKNRVELDRILEERLMQADTEQWTELFIEEDIAGAPVNTVDKAALDPQVLNNNMILTLQRPSDAPVKVAGNPIKVTGLAEEHRAPPALGEHNQEILADFLGYSEEKIRQLEKEQKAHVNELEEHLNKKR
ncbi:MAG: CoA transferase [Chloroflexi bacterium]|nr:CoA transferase [Chloroflexota bacterium]